MRTCTRCGAQFPDDELICPKCGQEVQLVPDYVTIESRYQEDELKKEEEAKKRREEEERQAAIDARKKQIRRNVTLTICLFVAAVIAVILFVVFARINRNSNSFSYQYDQANTAYHEGDYSSAERYAQTALSIDKDNTDAMYLLSEIYLADNQTDKAEQELLTLIGTDSGNTKAYDLLIKTYSDAGQNDKIVDLLKKTKNKKILEKYADYLPQAPKISPDGGTFKKEVEISISSDSKGTIYYTTDGSAPTDASEKYDGSFTLQDEGNVTVSAVVITSKGISSDVTKSTFKLAFDTPPTPKISPASGSYESSDVEDPDLVSSSSENTSEITVDVPNGFTCYYAFDKKPTKDSEKYTKPVEMKEGEHIFYAVLQDNETGKLGKTASATYIYAIVTPTPTVIPTPTASAPSSYVPPSSTKDAEEVSPTPTEEPTPEPTEEPTEEPTPEPTTEPGDSQEQQDSSDKTEDSSDTSTQSTEKND